MSSNAFKLKVAIPAWRISMIYPSEQNASTDTNLVSEQFLGMPDRAQEFK
jgi:hypothetical protein